MKRVNDILLGPLERPILAWLSCHTPDWITPNYYTWVGIIGGVLTMAAFALTNLNPNFVWLGCLGLVINWLGDSLDGNLARYRKIERPKYGFFIDHMSDAFVAAIICLGIGLSPYVDMVYALAALVAYFLLSILTYVSSHADGEFRLSYGKIGPTEIRIVIIVCAIAAYFIPNSIFKLNFIELTLFDLITLIGTLLLVVGCLIATVRTSWRLSSIEPPLDFKTKPDAE